MPLEHPPPPPPPGGGKSGQSMIQWIKDVVTGPYEDKVKEKAIGDALK